MRGLTHGSVHLRRRFVHVGRWRTRATRAWRSQQPSGPKSRRAPCRTGRDCDCMWPNALGSDRLPWDAVHMGTWDAWKTWARPHGQTRDSDEGSAARWDQCDVGGVRSVAYGSGERLWPRVHMGGWLRWAVRARLCECIPCTETRGLASCRAQRRGTHPASSCMPLTSPGALPPCACSADYNIILSVQATESLRRSSVSLSADQSDAPQLAASDSRARQPRAPTHHPNCDNPGCAGGTKCLGGQKRVKRVFGFGSSAPNTPGRLGVFASFPTA
jgi:hypothetical protein